MGASKRIMEHLLFSRRGSMADGRRVTSSRFANVAFSNGSLLESFVQRFNKRQPLACPPDASRFFVSSEEAGQICLLASMCGPDRHVVIPRLDPAHDTRKLDDIAVAFLRGKGFEPEVYGDERAARAGIERDLIVGRYPLLLTPLDTAGEKACEIFVGRGESAREFGMSRLLAVEHLPASETALEEFIVWMENAVLNPDHRLEKSEIASAVAQVLPEFRHLDRSAMLDQRM
jgi:FlaA1/EpsC-like NDP-sugar epimerase